MSDVASIMQALEDSAAALDKAATRLAKVTKEYEGTTNEQGEWVAGPQLLWEGAVAAEAARIYNESKKPPPEAVRDSMAEATVKAKHPELWADYHRLRSEIQALQKWISAKKETISARQSVLSAEKALLTPIANA